MGEFNPHTTTVRSVCAKVTVHLLFPSTYTYGLRHQDRYMSELLELDYHRVSKLTRLPAELPLIVTPLRCREWAATLAHHPHRLLRSTHR